MSFCICDRTMCSIPMRTLDVKHEFRRKIHSVFKKIKTSHKVWSFWKSEVVNQNPSYILANWHLGTDVSAENSDSSMVARRGRRGPKTVWSTVKIFSLDRTVHNFKLPSPERINENLTETKPSGTSLSKTIFPSAKWLQNGSLDAPRSADRAAYYCSRQGGLQSTFIWQCKQRNLQICGFNS